MGQQSISFFLKGLKAVEKKKPIYGETSPPNMFKLKRYAINNIMGRKHNLYSFMKHSHKKLYGFYKSNHFRKSLFADFVADIIMIMAQRQLDISNH